MIKLFTGKKEKKDVLNIKDNQFFEIELKEECTQKEYETALNNIKKMNIQRDLLLTNDGSIFDRKLIKQKIIVMNFNNSRITIVVGDEEIRISEVFRTSEDFIDENIVKISKEQVFVTKYIHDLCYNTKFCKYYPNDNPRATNSTLEKSEAISICKSLIHFLSHIVNINETVDLDIINQTIDNMDNGKQFTIGTIK